MQHNRAMLLSVCPNIINIESLRKLEIKLDGSALPRSAYGIFQMKIKFRSIEGAVSFIYCIGLTHSLHCFFQSFRSKLPILITSDGMFRSR